jgi:Ca2+/Na+ antiporter
MEKAIRVSAASRSRAAASTAWRTLWPCVRATFLWLWAIELAPLVYLLFLIACGSAALRRREAGIAKAFGRVATFLAAALVATCTTVEKVARTSGGWLSKKAGLPWPR